MNDYIEPHPEEWENIRDTLFDALSKGELPIYEPKMNAFLEQTVYKYLRPTDEPISLTDTAKRFDSENPSYLIQSWLRSRNTIELKWMRILHFFAITFFAFPQLMTFLTIFTIGIVSYKELVRDLNTEQKIELLQQYKDRFLQINGKYYCYNEGFCDFEFDNDNSLTLKM